MNTPANPTDESGPMAFTEIRALLEQTAQDVG